MSGRMQHGIAWAVAIAAAALAAALSPGAARADLHARSPLDSAGLVRPPRAVGGLAMHVAAPSGPDYPGAVWEPASPSNYSVADRPLTSLVTRIVIHVAEGGWASTYTWFRNPRAQASANYVVSSGGRVAQMVPDRDIAWHAGNWDYNESSIGIEHAGFTNRTRFPDAEYRGSARLAAWIADTYWITPDRRHVIGHNQVPDPNHKGEWGGVDHHTDPGRTWSWTRYMAYLRADARDTFQQTVDNSDRARVQYDSRVWRRATAQPGHLGADYLTTRPRRTPSPVTYRLNAPASDRYDLMMRWPCGADSTRAGVRILTTAGWRNATVDEARGCGRFQLVGSYDLAAGDAGRVRISSVSSARGDIVADAVKLVEQSDPTPPTAPAVTATPSETSVSVRWKRAGDNIAVGGYHVVVDQVLRYVGSGTSTTIRGLACGAAHTVSVRALDLVSNASPKHLVSIETGACPQPPAGLAAAPTRHAVALTWTAHSYLSYRVLVNGREVATTAAGAHTVSGLACGKSHTFGVESVDAADGVSAPAEVRASTLAC